MSEDIPVDVDYSDRILIREGRVKSLQFALLSGGIVKDISGPTAEGYFRK